LHPLSSPRTLLPALYTHSKASTREAFKLSVLSLSLCTSCYSSQQIAVRLRMMLQAETTKASMLGVNSVASEDGRGFQAVNCCADQVALSSMTAWCCPSGVCYT
jgi:hypothetical protein